MVETHCQRCHQALEAGACFCAVCGLPQLLFAGDQQPESDPAEVTPVRDAGSIDWKAALRFAVMLAVPVGMLCNMLSPLGILGAFLMGMAATWVVLLYMRNRRPAWLTMGAGARLGLVTGLLGSGSAAATTGIILFVSRFLFHQGKFFDDLWQNLVAQQMPQQWQAMGIDQQTIVSTRNWLLSSEGRAGWMLVALSLLMLFLTLFAMVGGVIGARMVARSQRPQV